MNTLITIVLILSFIAALEAFIRGHFKEDYTYMKLACIIISLIGIMYYK